jgi:uncharacterized surface protein with fasciclin (FAS1) repeats
MMNFLSSTLVVLLASSSICSVAASPNGASACPAGVAAPGGSHTTQASVTTGPLSDGGLTVTIGGVPVTDGMTVTDLMFDVVVSGAAFKGYLIRAGNTDVTEVTPDADGAVADACGGAVGAVTHTSRDEKTTATATVDLLQPGTIDFDISVVIENGGGISTYYYSPFTVNVEQTVSVVTTGPTAAPTATPVDDVTTTAPPTVAPSAATATNTIVDVAIADDDLSTLVTAVVAANLAGTLSTADPITVFAPTNEALSTLDPKFLTENWMVHLDLILKYHVTDAGAVLAADLTNGQVITMLSGETITATVADTGVSFSGASFTDSLVVAADIMADNGVIHKVNQFFLPTQLTVTLLELAQAAPQFARVAQLLAASGLESELAADDRTIFVPSDDAFSAIPEATFQEIATDNALLTDLLSNHLGVGVYPEALLVDGFQITTINDFVITITTTGAGRFIDYFANGFPVTVRNQIGSNGLAHIMEGVMGVEGSTPPPVAPDGPTTAPSTAMPVEPTTPAPTTLYAPTTAPSGSAMVGVSTFMLVAATIFAQVL